MHTALLGLFLVTIGTAYGAMPADLVGNWKSTRMTTSAQHTKENRIVSSAVVACMTVPDLSSGSGTMNTHNTVKLTLASPSQILWDSCRPRSCTGDQQLAQTAAYTAIPGSTDAELRITTNSEKLYDLDPRSEKSTCSRTSGTSVTVYNWHWRAKLETDKSQLGRFNQVSRICRASRSGSTLYMSCREGNAQKKWKKCPRTLPASSKTDTEPSDCIKRYTFTLQSSPCELGPQNSAKKLSVVSLFTVAVCALGTIMSRIM